jgi:hypothetical protein
VIDRRVEGNSRLAQFPAERISDQQGRPVPSMQPARYIVGARSREPLPEGITRGRKCAGVTAIDCEGSEREAEICERPPPTRRIVGLKVESSAAASDRLVEIL